MVAAPKTGGGFGAGLPVLPPPNVRVALELPNVAADPVPVVLPPPNPEAGVPAPAEPPNTEEVVPLPNPPNTPT